MPRLGGDDGRKDVPVYWAKFKASAIGQRVLRCICNNEEAECDAQLAILRSSELGEPLASNDEGTLVLSPVVDHRLRATTTVFSEPLSPSHFSERELELLDGLDGEEQ